MRRKLSLLAVILTVGFAGACANPAAPSRDGDEDPSRCAIVVGTQTRCEPTDTLKN